MCSHYIAVKEASRLQRHFRVELSETPGKLDLWPGYLGSFVRRHPHVDAGDEAVPERECLGGVFGMIPHWATDTKIARSTFNSRSETAAEKPSFRDAWRKARHCVIPAESIFEPDWRSGKAVATKISHASGDPLGVAGLWASWRSPKGELVHSYTMLTINAEQHPLMRQFHKAADEKRMVVILPPKRYQDWLNAKPAQSAEFMQMFPAEELVSEPVISARNS
jgi:putative SOS response-associated peptidase YedK